MAIYGELNGVFMNKLSVWGQKTVRTCTLQIIVVFAGH